ncbi:GNAT family N-acetyltransferase [Vibrio algivorus]|uniref:Acetyltransferase n=1 Tax=Vibrio algivorus TaxID=1667024 RepID=A0ABQ6ELG2_9VIBR|nr:GNAT family N-acetyltransferase [Vibrio algivorus]GLT13606.1 acetyltransferase [Vibrio algivorus]
MNKINNATIHIRHYQVSDAQILRQLFFNTVRLVNTKDYTQAQVTAWAPSDYDEQVWAQHMQTLNPLVAEIDGKIVGYADLQSDGLIDHFFCHHQYQGCGVGKALMQSILELAKQRNIHTLYSHVSKTAKPFFERLGFVVEKKQEVEVREQVLTNFKMKKSVLDS